MFAFIEAKHGITSTSADENRQRKHRHSTRQFSDGTPWKLNQRPGTLCDVTSARPLQKDLPKWWQELDAKLKIIDESTEQQDSELTNVDGDTTRLNEEQTGTSRGRVGQRRNSDPPNSSPKVVHLRDIRRGSLPLFTPHKPGKTSVLSLFHGKPC